MPQFLSVYFSKQFKADVVIKRASWSLKEGIKTKGIYISNKRGLRCDIESAIMGTVPLSIAVRTSKGTVPLIFTLKNVELSYPDSAVINGITRALSLRQPGIFRFDIVSGKLYRRKGELVVKALNASGEHIRLFIDGTVIGGSQINCCFRILLAEELVASIPEATRKVFFKQDGSWSKVELYIAGDIQHPSINFSTDLFKLIVR